LVNTGDYNGDGKSDLFWRDTRRFKNTRRFKSVSSNLVVNATVFSPTSRNSNSYAMERRRPER
jgi:hypothetical protein